jgi:2-keto-4-pentenoate hydratase
MEKRSIEALAARLFEAERTCIPVQPPTEADPSMTVNDAYAFSWKTYTQAGSRRGDFPVKKSGLLRPASRTARRFRTGLRNLFQGMECKIDVPTDA